MANTVTACYHNNKWVLQAPAGVVIYVVRYSPAPPYACRRRLEKRIYIPLPAVKERRELLTINLKVSGWLAGSM